MLCEFEIVCAVRTRIIRDRVESLRDDAAPHEFAVDVIASRDRNDVPRLRVSSTTIGNRFPVDVKSHRGRKPKSQSASNAPSMRQFVHVSYDTCQ
jgi:hypothetical protein